MGHPGGCILKGSGYVRLNLSSDLGRKLRLENIVYILKKYRDDRLFCGGRNNTGRGWKQ